MISTAVSPKIGQAMATAVTRNNENRQTRLLPFYKALKAVTDGNAWATGETRSVFVGTIGGRTADLYLKNEGGTIFLHLFVKGKTLMDRFYSKPFQVALFDFKAGAFQISENASEGNYLVWNFKTRKAMSG